MRFVEELIKHKLTHVVGNLIDHTDGHSLLPLTAKQCDQLTECIDQFMQQKEMDVILNKMVHMQMIERHLMEKVSKTLLMLCIFRFTCK